MTAVVVIGLSVGIGCLGIVAGLKTSPPSLEVVLGIMNRLPEVPDAAANRTFGVGRLVAGWSAERGFLDHPRFGSVRTALAVTGESTEHIAERIFFWASAGLLGPPVLWAIASWTGLSVPISVPLIFTLVSVPLGAALPVAAVSARARERRRHFRVVIGTFIDLVVLSLAGGVGIEGALYAASQVSTDWAAQRLSRVLVATRESGRSPWVALAELGEEFGVSELVDLSATLQLAGTEGTRIRQALRARAVSLRRHEQAEAESAANATTERLFVPGALLLVGFLIFVGYPAFSRILGGF